MSDLVNHYADLDIIELRQRLAVAETFCIAFGWCAALADSPRAKAATQAWMDWSAFVGLEFTDPDVHPYFSDDWLAIMAARRDAMRSETLGRFGIAEVGE